MFKELKLKMSQHKNAVALINSDRKFSYFTLLDRIVEKEREYGGLGIRNGKIAAIIGDYSFDGIVCLLAALFCGATVIPLTRESYQKHSKQVSLLNVDYVIDTKTQIVSEASNNYSSSEQSWRNLVPQNAPGLIVFTSGSSGVPKGVIHNVDFLCSRYLQKREPFVSICFLQFDHMGGFNTLLSILFRGGTAISLKDRSPDLVCKVIESFSATLLPTTPSFLTQLLISNAHKKYDLNSLKVVSYGTEPMNAALLEKLVKELPDCKFKQTYGLSETGVLQISSKSNDSLWFKFTEKHLKYRVIDNILWLKTNSNLLGKLIFDGDFVSLERQTEEWFCTDDIIQKDGDYLRIMGRQSDVINVGGVKVYPAEVESCIAELPFVEDVTVVGKQNVLLGQMVVAHIQISKQTDKRSAEVKIRKHCLSKLERYKLPAQILFNNRLLVNDRHKKIRNYA